MKYLMEEIKEKIKSIRCEYSNLVSSIEMNKGWISKNFRSHILIDDILIYIEDWIIAIETNDKHKTQSWGNTEQELLDSCFGFALINHINSEKSYFDANLERDKIAIRLYLDIGTPGLVKMFDDDNNYKYTANLFEDCIQMGDFETFAELMLNTSEIMAEQFVEILIATNLHINDIKEFNSERNKITGLSGIFRINEDKEDEERLVTLDLLIISLLEKVINKENLLKLIKDKVDLIIRDNVKVALFKTELDVLLPNKPKRIKINKI